MRDKIEDILIVCDYHPTVIMGNTVHLIDKKEATKELYNLFLDEQINLLREIINVKVDKSHLFLHHKLVLANIENKLQELQKLKEL